MAESRPWTCALFDVDGTLVDSAPQVTGTFAKVLVGKGLPVPGPERLHRYVGPPLWWSFSDLGYTPEESADLVDTYRRLYEEVFLDPLPFPGVIGLLCDLHEAGLPLATATSKQQYMAHAQLEHLDLLPFFDVVAGATPGPGSTKATVIADALEQLTTCGVDVSRPVLVGDSIWDVEGGQNARIDVIGVSWGYGTDKDLHACVEIVHDADELRRLLLGGDASQESLSQR